MDANEQSITIDELYHFNDPAPHTINCGNEPTWQGTPERALWEAVLFESIYDCRRYAGLQTSRRGRPKSLEVPVLKRERDNRKRTKQITESWEWLHSDAIAPGSFRWTCEVLGLDPDYVRKELPF